MKKTGIGVILLIALFTFTAEAAETVTLVYQNDLHGWLFPSSTRPGADQMVTMLKHLLTEEPSAFYTMSGDLLTGPNLPEPMKGVSEIDLWNQFWQELSEAGFGQRVLISAGNHEFDYGVPPPGSISSRLLCANILTQDDKPYYLPYRVIVTGEGLRIGFLGLVMGKNRRVLRAAQEKDLRVIPMSKAVKRFLPEMGSLDLSVLMVHEHMGSILKLARELPKELGVDVIVSGHDHMVLDNPLVENGIQIFQAGAMNCCYGRAELVVDQGRVISLKNRIFSQAQTPLGHAMMRLKEKVDELNGKTVAILKQPLLGAHLRFQENSLGDFVTDAFRWATGSDVAMTNSSSLRMDIQVYPGEPFELKEGHLRAISPFQNHLMVARITGSQIMEILEGEALRPQNQVSGIFYRVDLRMPPGRRILDVRVQGMPVVSNRIYTLTHNSYCTRPENMERYLHLRPGTVTWKDTRLVDNDALLRYARRMKVIAYPPEGGGRIVIKGGPLFRDRQGTGHYSGFRRP